MIARLKQLLKTSPQGAVVVRLLDLVGARGAAERLERARGGPTIVLLPLPGLASSPSRVKMRHLDGRDQVARALREGGWGAFEPPLPAMVAILMSGAGRTLFDVGANTGLYSLIAAAAHPGARAVAFEPIPEIADLLRANVELNAVGDRVAIDPAAIGDSTGEATIYLPPPQLDGTIETSASLEADFKETIDTTLTVPTSTLDDAWRAHGSPEVTVVKIDVEGSEPRVLKGAKELLAACRPVVSVEVLGRLDVGPLDAAREELGFVDIILGARRVVVGSPRIVVDPDAPNHLLAPPERLDDVLAALARLPEVTVTGL